MIYKLSPIATLLYMLKFIVAWLTVKIKTCEKVLTKWFMPGFETHGSINSGVLIKKNVLSNTCATAERILLGIAAIWGDLLEVNFIR